MILESEILCEICVLSQNVSRMEGRRKWNSVLRQKKRNALTQKTTEYRQVTASFRKVMHDFYVEGTSARSSSIRLVLGSICWQIAAMYKMDFTDIPVDYPGLVSYFHDMLRVSVAQNYVISRSV